MAILEEMTNENDWYYSAYYNMVDCCRNGNMHRSVMGDIVWSFVIGNLSKQ